MNDVVYIAMYNPCFHESEWGVISVHKTKKGAETALALDEHNRVAAYGKTTPYEKYYVFEFKVQE